MALDVKVKIDLNKPAGKASFGYPLILDIGAERDYTECTSLADVVAAGHPVDGIVYKNAALMFSQNNRPAKIAVCSIADTTIPVDIMAKPWRQLVNMAGNVENIADFDTQISAITDKMLFADISIKDIAQVSTIKSDRTVLFVCENPDTVAALVGEAAGREVGSFTYKNLKLNGVEPEDYTADQLNTIAEANAITFVTKAGDNVTTDGVATSGEYIDIIDCKDYIIQQLEYQTQKTLNNMGKIPYDNNGIAILESVAVNVMKDAYNKGIIATNEDGTPAYSVNYLKREDTDPADRVERRYIGGQFSFTLAGAIHEVEITGEILI